jgi:WD40-like Beta Propeller Repeat
MLPSRALRRALLLAAAATALAAGPAAASSIVYVKNGNLWLTSPDGSKGYQVTNDGGYSSPSQADNGTIGAIRNGRLVRMNRSGRLLNAPIDAMGSPGQDQHIAGPYDARISPDGKRFAYWFFTTSSYYDPGDYREHADTESTTAVTAADHFTDPSTEGEYDKGFSEAEWITNDRLLGTAGFWMNMWTWKIGTGHGYTDGSAQFWFGLQDPPDQYGVPAYHWYDDPALSPDGTKLAMTDGAVGHPDKLYLAATHGPAWIGEPPYDNDLVYGNSPLARPTLECSGNFGAVVNPSWGPDSNTLAFGGKDGVHVMNIPDGFACAQATDRLLVPGGTEPAFGRADVNMAQKPGAGMRISRVRLTLRGRRPARLRFNASAPARVRVTISGIHGRLRLRAHAGRNAWRLRAPALRPGRHVLTVRGGGAVARLRFRVR